MKLFIKTFGCQFNEYDSFRIYSFLKKFFQCNLSFTLKNVDIVLINVCAVRANVERKSIEFIKSLYNFRIKENGSFISICFGCLSTYSKDVIEKYVDIVISARHLFKLPELLLNAINSKDCLKYKFSLCLSKFNSIDRLNDFFLTYYPKYRFFGDSVYIPISDGCNNYCTYCVVPYSRGFEICRDFNDIMSDVLYYVRQNVQEIILLGHNVNSYLDKNLVTFNSLLSSIIKVDNLRRVRFLTANPKDFSFELVELYSEANSITSHLHLPLQSGSDNVLKRMKRGYSIDDYRDIISMLKKRRSNLLVTTDLLVGFPGETLNDFLQTLFCVNEFSFDSSFCFIYSSRSQTPSSMYFDNVEFSVKLKRLKILQNALLVSTRKNTSLLINTKQHVLVYGFVKKNVYWGKIDSNRTVLFESTTYFERGKFVNVFILGNINNTLLAKLIM